MTIRVVKPGFFTTVQDRARFGCAHLGISPAGAADLLSLRIANLLVGNDQYAPALEMTLLGAMLGFEERTILAISGANCECRLGQDRLAANSAVEASAGMVLQCGSTTDGARSYLAVQGGFDVPLVMGSASTDIRGRFGGHDGRRLQAGDVLHIRRAEKARGRPLRTGALDQMKRTGPIRVTRGVQHDWFSVDAYANFLAATYTVSEQSDRAGLRLKGVAILPRESKQLLTDGIPLGAIQVPQDGQPIILFVDQQTTGGYPKIANVIAADMRRIGQLRPRDGVQFAEVSIANAIEALDAQERWLKEIWQD
ncbi:MAG TPA: biotin-dependent carboxyltransferase family protein [Candidatus Eisenbacteria bacterium]|nr:biotin-dependent carboxyltransferase family protein [Candidatus Eisenbacteria bacterium]